MTAVTQRVLDFPKKCSAARPIPPEIWPDLKGILKVKYEVKPSKRDPLVMEITGGVRPWRPTLESWREFWKTAARFPVVSVDTETSGLRPFHGSKIAGISGAFWDGEVIQAGYWNFRHVGHAEHGDCRGYREKAPVIPIGEMKRVEQVYRDTIVAGQNFKFDSKMGHVDGLVLPRRVLDTQLIAHLWDEVGKKYNLDLLAKEMGELKLGDTIAEYMSLHGLSLEDHGHAQVAFEVERPYAIMDTVLVLRRLQWERERWLTLGDPKLMDVFQVENACTHAYSTMEIAGMKLDIPYIREGVKKLEAEVAVMAEKIYKAAGKFMGKKRHEFKILSTEQLWRVLEARGFKPNGTTPSGDPALDDGSLACYHDDFCNMIREFRAKSKTLRTYFKPFLEDYVNEKGALCKAHSDPDGFLHSDYFVHGTTTGRTSSREPNLQNIPRFEKFGSRGITGEIAKAVHEGLKNEAKILSSTLEVRRCFVPRDRDYSMFFFDYSQFELRVFADYAEEEFMLAELEKGADLHASVAREVFANVPKKEDNPVIYSYFRQLAKMINFGILYGMGVGKLSINLDIPLDECTRLVQLAQEALRVDPVLAASCCTYSESELESVLEDHRVMWNSRQWQGVKALNKEVACRINPGPMEELLIRDGKNIRLSHSAREFMNRYHARFPKIKVFTKAIDQAIRSRGYVFNRFGRRYHLPVEKSYVGVNRLIQGTTGEIKKLAAARVASFLEDLRARTRMTNDVHDELQFDVHHRELDLVPQVRELMEAFPQVGVKLKVDVDYSHESWASKTKWEGPEKFLESLVQLRGTSGAKKPGRRGK